LSPPDVLTVGPHRAVAIPTAQMSHAPGIVARIAPPRGELPLKMVDLYRFDKATDESGRSIGSQTRRRLFAR